MTGRNIRRHSSGDMAGLGELRDITEPVAAVIRPDGSIDVYGHVAIVDQAAQVQVSADEVRAQVVTLAGLLDGMRNSVTGSPEYVFRTYWQQLNEATGKLARLLPENAES